ncbi:MAG: hypothetical protein ABIH90_00520 [Candidatus Aenigmatarchaeota archaeon]
MRQLIPLLLVLGLLMIIAAMAYQLFSTYVASPEFTNQTKPFEARITQMSMPRPGQAVKMAVFAKSLQKCDDLRLSADISQAFEVISGETSWIGEAYPGDIQSITFVVGSRGTGTYTIKGHVECRRLDGIDQDTVVHSYEIGNDYTEVFIKHE